MRTASSFPWRIAFLAAFMAAVCLLAVFVMRSKDKVVEAARPEAFQPEAFQPRLPGLDTSGYQYVMSHVRPWDPNASLSTVADRYVEAPVKAMAEADAHIADLAETPVRRASWFISRAMIHNYAGRTADALASLAEGRALAESDAEAGETLRYTIIYYQGVSSLRLGEDENCIMCRGEGTCILPLARSARHTNRRGSELAVGFFSEYLERFPDDLEVKWLLNFAHMTLDEHPAKVDPKNRLTLEKFGQSEFDIGRFRDVGAAVGVNRLNFQGGGLMDDFDNDGRLDIVVTANHPSEPMAFFRNRGDGTFEDRTKEAGLVTQTGGLYCVQADYNNDGRMDIFIPRGAWMPAASARRIAATAFSFSPAK